MGVLESFLFKILGGFCYGIFKTNFVIDLACNFNCVHSLLAQKNLPEKITRTTRIIKISAEQKESSGWFALRHLYLSA